MSRMTSKLTTAVAGLALASLPVLVDAQSTSTQSPQQTTPRQTTGSQQNRNPRSSDQNSPQHHLDEAKRVLNSINGTSLQGEARTQITELKRHFNQLESAWRSSSAASARSGAARSTDHAGGHTGTATSGATGTTGSATTGSGTTEQTEANRQSPRSGSASSMAGNDWMTHYTAITNLLDQLVPNSDASVSGAAGTTAGTAGTGTTGSTTGSASGTSGSAGRGGARGGVSASATVSLDANVRSKLTEFRRHLDMFHSAAMAQSGRGEEDAASASAHSGITGSMTGTTGSATGTSGSTTGTTSSATGTTGAATGTTGSATGTTGSAIGTTGSTTGTTSQTSIGTSQPTAPANPSGRVDSAAIARLTASIDEMLRGSASTTTAAGTTSTGTTGTTGTTGSTTSGTTAGTSGASNATGTVCVDRAKLEQLRRELQALQNPR